MIQQPLPVTLQDQFVERTLGYLRGGFSHVDCPQDLARRILSDAFREHARALQGLGAASLDYLPVKFSVSQGKALEAVLLVLSRWEPLPTPDLYRVLYLAERDHLNRWGRPIFGDTYRATPVCPVPTTVEAMIVGDHGLLKDPWKVTDAIRVHEGPPLRLERKRNAWDELLSASDTEALGQAVARCRGRGFSGAAAAQWDPGWGRTPPGALIDWADMLDAEAPDREARIGELREVAATLVL